MSNDGNVVRIRDVNPIRLPEGNAPKGDGPNLEIPLRWRSESPTQHPLPKQQDTSAWEECYNCINEYDEDMCRTWKEEIDKLLVFAGLFSAAVTAFAVESYQWLADPSDVNTNLLMQLVLLQNNSTSPSQLIPPFKASSSAIRINIFWFLSLILSLGSVIIGILCLEWLREYQRPASTASFKEKLTYRQIRHDGLMQWRVPQIVSLIPLLLHISLILFFFGIFDLLWERNHLVGEIILVPIALIVLFLIVSTLLPGIQIYFSHRSKESVMAHTQCPYKSPQSWAFFRLMVYLLNVSLLLSSTKSPIRKTWFTLDQFWDDQHAAWDGVNKRRPQLARAFEWIQDNLAHHSEVTYNLYQCLPSTNGATKRAIIQWFRKHLVEPTYTEVLNAENEASPNSEVVSALFLSTFHHYTPGIVEHWIRAVNSKPTLFRFMPMKEVRKLPRELQDEYYPQVILCGLASVKHPDASAEGITLVLEMLKQLTAPVVSPLTTYLIQLSLAAIIRWFKDSHQPQDIKEKELTRWMNVWGVSWVNISNSYVTKALIMELAYDLAKANEERRLTRASGDDLKTSAIQLSDIRWRMLLRVESIAKLTSKPESELWWKKYLDGFTCLDISNFGNGPHTLPVSFIPKLDLQM